MKIKSLKTFRNYLVPLFLLLYVIFHFFYTQFGDLTPWKLGGYGMYSTYHPDRSVIWLEADGKRMNAKDLSELKDNLQYHKQLKKCRTLPNEINLQRLYSKIYNNTGRSYKIEVWRPNFDIESQNLSYELVNSLENTVTE